MKFEMKREVKFTACQAPAIAVVLESMHKDLVTLAKSPPGTQAAGSPQIPSLNPN